MFDNMTEQQAKAQILEMVDGYCKKYHNQQKPFEEGDRIPYASRVYDSQEMMNLVDSALEFWLTAGRYADQFEKKICGIPGNPFLFPGKFRFLSQPSGVYGADLSPSEGTPGAAGRRGDHSGGRLPHNSGSVIQYGAVPVFVGCDDPSVQY